MEILSTIDKMISGGIICAIGAGIETTEQARSIVNSLFDGGLNCFELMRGVPNALSLITDLKKDYPGAVFGIGTVLDTETARLAVLAGADFLVSPYLNKKLIKLSKRYGVVSCFGALTPTEIINSWEAGLDLVKVFPTMSMGGPEYIKILKGPLPHMRLVGAGGIRLEEIGEYFKAGASIVAVDEDLIVPDWVKKGNYHKLCQRAQEYRAELDKRESKKGE